MPVYDVYGERKQQEVMESTWGHLRAKPGEVFAGVMVFCHTLEGYTMLLAQEFGELDCSPWLHEDTEEYMERIVERDGFDRGAVYRFEGKYIVSPRGRRRFSGRVKKMNTKKLFQLPVR